MALVKKHRQPQRFAFTLIELMVVMAIMMALGAIGLRVSYKTGDKPRDGADRVQGWLLMAKQWALRDQAPRGIRLSGSGGLVTRLTYIEQPEDWAASNSRISYSTTALPAGKLPGTNVDFWGGFDGTDPSRWPIGPGDMIEIDSGINAQIVATIDTVQSPTELRLRSPFPSNDFSTLNYRIIRRPRARIGEMGLELPTNVVIDLNTNAPPPTGYGSPLPPPDSAGNIDILFTSSGSVIGPGLSGRDIKLWIRSLDPLTDPEKYIVTITLRTGLISVHPVAPGANPYAYTEDGRSSGL